MPIQLHLDAAGPLDDGIDSDRVLERFDNHFGSGGTSGPDRAVHIRNQISGAFLSERKRHRRLVRKD
jgi:hypothetical protein